MSGTASNYGLSRMMIGIVLAGLSFLAVSMRILQQSGSFNIDTLIIYAITAAYGVMMFASSYVEEEQHFWYWITAGWVAYLHCRSIQSKKSTRFSFSAIQIATLAILHSHRIIQRWNQTGQKYAGAPDIVTRELNPQPILLWALVALTYLAVYLRIGYTFSHYFNMYYIVGLLSATTLVVPALVFKVAFTSADAPELFYFLQGEEVEWLQQLPLVSIARGIFANLAAHVCILFIAVYFYPLRPKEKDQHRLLSALHSLLALLLLTQSRTVNTPLFLLFLIQYLSLTFLSLSPTQITISTLLFAHTSFFALGNSNAISSIDLSNAYNGVSGYNVLAVGILVFVGNWAGPIWWAVSATVLLAGGKGGLKSDRDTEKKKPTTVKAISNEIDLLGSERLPDTSYANFLALSTLFTSGSLLAVMIACTALRTHLFIWTVFSPKYLYSMAWTLGYHLLVNCVLNGALLSLK
jgi:ethanolamine phosphate transferase 2 subunit G